LIFYQTWYQTDIYEYIYKYIRSILCKK